MDLLLPFVHPNSILASQCNIDTEITIYRSIESDFLKIIIEKNK